jgi:hypothetical protein
MKKFIKIAITLQVIGITLLAACAPGVGASANVCHATGDTANPYQEITIDSTELLNEHRVHANDIFPVPASGCPTSLVEVTDGNITICHATNSESNPYEELTISVNGLNGHGDHEGDIIPMPAEGCPVGVIVTDVPTEDADDDVEFTVCHATGDVTAPYEELSVTEVELSMHLEHTNDINPVPATGCPTYPIVITDGQVTYCHATGDALLPYEEITVSVDGLDDHDEHVDDVFPISEEEGCPTTLVTDKITICHATSSKKNPYVQITISVNGLNGHDKHSGDIIPMPAGGCP